MSRKIEYIHAHEILDSRGNPTINATVLLQNGISGSASVPSGASTGVHEAVELRDNDAKRYGGKGVQKAVKNVNTIIAKELIGADVTRQRDIDETMIRLDNTVNKSKLGANAILAVSLACARAGAKTKKKPLYVYLRSLYGSRTRLFHIPTPTMNILNGGAHAGWVVDFQEFMIVPQQKRFVEKLRCGAEVFHEVAKIIKRRGFTTGVGDEGGYAVPFARNEDALKTIMQAIKAAGYRPKIDVAIAMDPAASEFYNEKTGKYNLKKEGKSLSAEQMIKLYESWAKKYPIISIEDGLAEDDWDNWKKMTKKLGRKMVLVGDDLFVTNVKRLQQGIESKVANAILIKVNQIGTLSEAFDAILLAQKFGYKVSVSHRSGETADSFIADLAVAADADFVKFGSLSRSERLAKYNRLIEIAEEIR
ncbi:MAG: phosphopyruvate hydratase [Patescibacteria group bacterium]